MTVIVNRKIIPEYNYAKIRYWNWKYQQILTDQSKHAQWFSPAIKLFRRKAKKNTSYDIKELLERDYIQNEFTNKTVD